MLKITIPKPCHENWDKMTPNLQGRHCSSCAKTVVDFTQMTDHEVRHFLINKKPEQLCGRFSSIQLQQINIELPQNIFQLQLPTWKQFLVASLLVFSTTLFSCAVNIKGEVVSLANSSPTLAMNIIHVKDTVPAKRTIVGEPAVERRVSCSTKGEVKVTVLMGDTVNIEVPKPGPEIMEAIAMVERIDTAVPKQVQPMIMGKMIASPGKNKKE